MSDRARPTPFSYRELAPADDNDNEEDEVERLVAHAAAAMPAESEPETVQEALKRMDAHLWREAMDEEMKQHMENMTWEVVKLPRGEKLIGSGWVFKVKRNSDGTVERYKARLVAKGYSQRPGYDYVEVFAPTYRPTSLRLLLALCAIKDFHLRSVDISQAFTNGDLEETIYMRQPQGYEVGGKDYVCKLLKSLYGLKQAARCWNQKLHEVFVKMGFARIESDRSVYVYTREEVKIIVPVYIDDITFASPSKSALDLVVVELGSYFKLRDLLRAQI